MKLFGSPPITFEDAIRQVLEIVHSQIPEATQQEMEHPTSEQELLESAR